MNNNIKEYPNKATRLITIVLGIILAISGMHHGFFEILQGNKPTNSLIIQAISPEYQRWTNGEEAFTLVPNFLITGILAIITSLIIIFWVIAFVHKRYGRVIFLMLFILLTLVGGGLGYIVFFVPIWAYATRMNRPLEWWKKVLSQGVRKVLAKIWRVCLTLTSAFFMIALEISVFGIPGITNDDTILTICWSFLFAALFLMNLTYISGFAYDIENR